jgi:tRNA uridine 5-carboxymethylaminomethyl modification enzyme
MEIDEFDVIVIGTGHSGIEAAAASARRGVNTAMFTTDYDNIGQMSCNPAVGGLAKGQIALEVDALGGIMGRATEEAGIQFRTLNQSKGPAVQAPRAQCDRALYKRATKDRVEQQQRLTVKQDKVNHILTNDDSVTGIRTATGVEYHADAVVVCTGTFLRGQIHLGQTDRTGGRSGEAATTKLAESLERFGFEHGRLKTGTPPRIDGQTVNYDVMDEQHGEEPAPRFSFFREEPPTNNKPCWITRTDDDTHELIRDNLDRSPIYGTGVIDGTGVRYCPSIEDKVVQFEDQDSHTIFLEPEGRDTTELYVNGLSTSLPPDVQQEMVRSVDGLENAEITRWGYAIEYDFYQPTQLNATLETREVPGLYFAGQINGTTGYEEAAGQGIIAGINAANQVLNADSFTLDRTQAYIGVLIDDLVTQGTEEPYRMFTSRAEHRLCLRKDNAHYRLTPLARELDLIDDNDWEQFVRERESRDNFEQTLKDTRVKVNSNDEKRLKETVDENLSLSETDSVYNLLKRPEIGVEDVIQANIVERPSPDRVAEQVGVAIKYEGYINRQQGKIEKARRMEKKTIPEDIVYEDLPELSNESIEKLNEVRPETLGQAERISGVKPSDIQIIMMHLERTPDQKSQPA